jgi:hypothetical protein
MGKITQQQSDLAPRVSASAPQRKHEVVRNLKLELISALVANDEHAHGFNPYDKKPGGSARDVWGRARRA